MSGERLRVAQPRACRLAGVDPKTVRRERPPDTPKTQKEMQAVAAKRRRFGYPLAGKWLNTLTVRRRIGVMLERKGMIMNHS